MKLRDFLRTMGLDYSSGARGLTAQFPDRPVSPKQMRAWCLPPGNDDQAYPRDYRYRDLYVWSGGAVAPNDFHDLPDLIRLSGAGQDGPAAAGGAQARSHLPPLASGPPPGTAAPEPMAMTAGRAEPWGFWLGGRRIGRRARRETAIREVDRFAPRGGAAVINQVTGEKWVRRGGTWGKTRDRWPDWGGKSKAVGPSPDGAPDKRRGTA